MKKILLGVAIMIASFTTDGQVGVGTANPEGVLDIVSTNSGFVFPRVVNTAAVTTPVDGMVIYDLSLSCFNFYENGAWKGCLDGSSSIGNRDTTTAVVDVTNPVTGKTWMDRNLGATQAATSSSDAASYGDLYQWGRAADGHQLRTSSTTTVLATTTSPDHGDFILSSSSPNDWLTPQDGNLWQGVAGINNPCPVGYRIPTETELNNERLSWGSNNDAAGALGSPLKLPLAGERFSANGTVAKTGTDGYYRSSTFSGANNESSYLFFSTSNALISDYFSGSGFSVRCTKNVDNAPPPTPVYCTGSATAIVDVTNPATGKTWMDRNLGATQAATSATDVASYGDLYQWGRFTDGHQCRTSSTTTTLATTSAPEHGDFIAPPGSPYNWLTLQDDNLWQGADGINNPCPVGYRIPTNVELLAEYTSNTTGNTFNSPLKLPLGGWRLVGGAIRLDVVGTGSNYWASAVSGTGAFIINSNSATSSSGSFDHRAYGMSVRCIKD